MLFIESRVCEQGVDAASRTFVLDKLQEQGLTPLIRTTRLACYEQALLAPERTAEMERQMAALTDAGADAPYVRGDLFCFEDHALYLIFGGAEDGVRASTVRAGIIHHAETREPTEKLDAFCRALSDVFLLAVHADAANSSTAGSAAPINFVWRRREEDVPASFARFSAEAGAGETREGVEASERLRAVEILEDAEARRFLRRLSDAQTEGRTADMLVGATGTGEHASEDFIGRLSGAGLVKRELLVSCRKAGRSLFRLPSADALAVLTASGAVCSECGTALADERAEELVTPTATATGMLKDGAWLVSRMRSSLVELGVPERAVAVRPAGGETEAQLMAHVCGEPFLFILRDGDVSLAQARRALDLEAETEASHLVVVATGKIQDEARARLREHARRRARAGGGGGVEMILVEGVEVAATELRQALERVSQNALSAELYELDASLGLSAGHLIATRFRLVQPRTTGLKDLAASAAGALAGSLREI
ncbi:MAG TPA: hypothetical protein VGV59_15090 [Pyrinomonadaceae bacterium]|nr:hypothetical protein [Pyrinomonadaceae bacterium]